MSDYVEHNSVFTRFEVGQSWAILSPIEQSIKRKIEAVGKPLKDWDVKIYRGILTGCNEAFIIDGTKKDELIAKDPKSAEIIRPILRGKDIKRYGYDFHDKWLITTHNGLKEKNIPPVDVTKYPSIKAHLDQFYPQLAKRQDKGDTPYNLRNCAYMDDFSKQKIAWSDLARTGNAFVLDESGAITLNTCYILTLTNDNDLKIKYLLSILNSKLCLFYIDIISSKLDSTGYRWFKEFVEKIPVIKDFDYKLLAHLVDSISNLKKINEDTSALENKIDKNIYTLYGLNNDEIEIINNTLPQL